MARLILFAVATAVVVFCVVQDRVTAAAARRYVQLHRAAMAGAGSAPALDVVMTPGVRRSVRFGLLSGAAAGVLVIGGGALSARRSRRE